MKLYLHIGEVQGAGAIPIDMLRYDQAFPYRETDSAEIERRARLSEYRSALTDGFGPVQIATKRTTKQHPWTQGRWNSFNRSIKHIETREIP
jgi:hypothetical protein